MINTIIFDFGNTLIHQVVDAEKPLNEIELELMQGAKELLEEMQPHFNLTILSNTEKTTSEQLNKCLKNLKIDKLFSSVFTSVSIGYRKPDINAFKTVLQALRISPEEAVMIGNDLTEDIAGARSTNIPTVYVSNTLPKQMDNMTRWIKNIEDLNINIIKSLEVQNLSKDPTDQSPNGQAELFKQKAQIGEKKQNWREIAVYWDKCARLLNPYPDKVKVLFEDPDATKHNFPQITPSSWGALSTGQKAARAFRYAGYYYDEDGEERRSSYAWYRASALCYAEEQRYDEASRSYYLASISYIQRFGELSSSYLKELEHATSIAVSANPEEYLHAMIIYYRKLGAALRAKGNHKHFIGMRKKRIKSQQMLFKHEKKRFRAAIIKAWELFADYGQSLTRWIILFVAIIFGFFPFLYYFFGGVGPTLNYLETIIFTIERSVSYVPKSVTLSTFGDFLSIIQALFSIVWFGAAVAIIVNRSQE
jgi:FMN phosphatase YigB (HAD superfamily)